MHTLGPAIFIHETVHLFKILLKLFAYLSGLRNELLYSLGYEFIRIIFFKNPICCKKSILTGICQISLLLVCISDN